MKSEDELLKSATQWKRRKRKYVGTNLGTLINQYVQRSVKPKQRKSSPIVEAWKKVVPPGLEQDCKIQKVKGGIITISVNNVAYLYQFQTSKRDLIVAMQEHCKRIKIQDIKFVLGRN